MLNYQTAMLPPELRAAAYLEKQLLAFNMLVGQVVHDTIDSALREFQRTGQWPSNLCKEGERVLKETVRFSRTWSQVAKRPGSRPERSETFRPVDLFYYDDELTEEIKLKVRSDIAGCLRRFSQHPIFADIMTRPKDWRLPPKPGVAPWFWSGDVPVYANYDFALVNDDGVVVIDWKTGRNQQAEARVYDQLKTYAAFAMEEWNVSLDRTKAIAAWLGDDRPASEFSYTEKEIEEAREDWADQRAQMRVRIALAEAEPQHAMQSFPLTPQVWRCKNCTFRSCEGRKRINSAEGLPPLDT
jgi:hypothetical protein